ncbi:SMI1/KNR4 family protein [Streptosporangium sp. 'caverna']|uniref:SMI1/KNR4 family protein n=1 Tax=Streptosporangium sp. 'caverna' TaxID=2202249 RepID=UPI000D7E8481|nr:SMI1/KNR4 family protein [Streptosporangium sp. 'caverna']AWS42941.1 SMI1/KNR4 family protein [Streptosporangium sp. 'caverna']
MTDIDDLLRRVSVKASAPGEPLPPPATTEEVAQTESVLGFGLPSTLARLYCEVANGGFGPDYRLFPLWGEGRTAANVYREERSMSESGGEVHWPAGVLPILDWGCGMYAAVDCRSPEGTVLVFEPNGIDGDWHRAWYLDSESLAGWLEVWLSETGWYEEDAGEDSEIQPWKMARQRLSERE